MWVCKHLRWLQLPTPVQKTLSVPAASAKSPEMAKGASAKSASASANKTNGKLKAPAVTTLKPASQSQAIKSPAATGRALQ